MGDKIETVSAAGRSYDSAMSMEMIEDPVPGPSTRSIKDELASALAKSQIKHSGPTTSRMSVDEGL